MKRSKSDTEKLVPIWFQLPRHFYQTLAKVSEESGLTMAKVLTRGVKLVRKEIQAKQASGAKPKSLAELRWAKTSPEERSRQMRDLAKMRWSPPEKEVDPPA